MLNRLGNKVRREFLATCEGIRYGRLILHTPEDETLYFGESGKEAELDLHSWSVVTATLSRGDIGLGECYVAGLWDTPSIEDFAYLALKNLDHFNTYAQGRFWTSVTYRLSDRLLRANTLKGAARNIHAHYDVGNDFYQLWLDDGMTYSSALFAGHDTDLHRAQQRKYDRILERLGKNGRGRTLEIGCGWGGFADQAADSGRDVVGITISPSQKGYADALLDGRADIRLQDYRKTQGKFDNIVSIEMIESVGERYWPNYFSTLKARLAQDGTAVLQAITVPNDHFPEYRRGSDYIRRYTFPGGMLVSDAVIAEQAGRAGLKVTNSFAFGQDYATTCRLWLERLTRQENKITSLGYSNQFIRNWRYYLGICAATFAVGQTDVVQVELTHA